jgi:hypothetical protein
MIKLTIDLLGYRAKDKITGLEGVISSVCFDLYGCVQAAISPPAKDGSIPDGRWFDVQRLEVSGDRVMSPPDFDAKDISPAKYDSGPAEKAPPR